MLQSLTIDNYALIDHLEFCPGRGLNVITGETGAGKSIIMGALGLILGQRADSKAVRQSEAGDGNSSVKCVIEAQFDVSQYGLEAFFADNELDYDPSCTIIRREIQASGKSRAFVNDSPVQLPLLRELGAHLIDIHSQHQNLLLGEDAFQMSVVDALAGNTAQLTAYSEAYQRLAALRRQIAKLRHEAEQNAKEADYLRYQHTQLVEAELTEGEQEELEDEQEVLTHAEDIKSGLYELATGLDDEQYSIVQQLKTLSRKAQELTDIYPDLAELAERLENDYYDLNDISNDISRRADRVSYDPERMEEIEERLSTIYDLQRKHSVNTIEGLIALRDELGERLRHIDSSDEEIEELEMQEKELATQTTQLAQALTQTRQKSAKALQKALIERVSYLGMPNLRFEVQVSPAGSFTPSGADQIEFLFSANKNQPLRPAGEVASGGEISRLMLGIKSLVASARTLPTIIFDEIDTGVSGDIADRMGAVMKELSAHLQVITITHLPQVAGKGSNHFRVYKADTAEQTITHIEALSAEQRLNEIARMLSGSNITPESLANARTLIAD